MNTATLGAAQWVTAMQIYLQQHMNLASVTNPEGHMQVHGLDGATLGGEEGVIHVTAPASISKGRDLNSAEWCT